MIIEPTIQQISTCKHILSVASQICQMIFSLTTFVMGHQESYCDWYYKHPGNFRRNVKRDDNDAYIAVMEDTEKF